MTPTPQTGSIGKGVFFAVFVADRRHRDYDSERLSPSMQLALTLPPPDAKSGLYLQKVRLPVGTARLVITLPAGAQARS